MFYRDKKTKYLSISTLNMPRFFLHLHLTWFFFSTEKWFNWWLPHYTKNPSHLIAKTTSHTVEIWLFPSSFFLRPLRSSFSMSIRWNLFVSLIEHFNRSKFRNCWIVYGIRGVQCLHYSCSRSYSVECRCGINSVSSVYVCVLCWA